MADPPTRDGGRRVDIIEAVKTPLGFLTLGVLVLEALGVAYLPHVEGRNETLLLLSMVIVLVVYPVFVLWLSYHRPELLRPPTAGAVPAELEPLVQEMTHQREIARSIEGRWRYQASTTAEDGSTRQVPGGCLMRAEGSRLVIEGEWRDETGNAVGHWSARQVLLDSEQLTFLFEVQERPGTSVLGVTQVRILHDEQGAVDRLSGTWGVLSRTDYGAIDFERES